MNALHRRRIRKLAAFLAGPVARADAKARRRGTFKFKMDSWSMWNDGSDPDNPLPTKVGLSKNLCNTAACALGWATVVFPRSLKFRYGGVVSNSGSSRDFFGMTKEQWDEAFVPHGFNEWDRTPAEAAAVLRKIANERRG